MTILAKSLKSLRLCQVEYLPSKQGVAGSSPAGAAKIPGELGASVKLPLKMYRTQGTPGAFQNTEKPMI